MLLKLLITLITLIPSSTTLATAENKPGWQEWQPVNQSETLPFTSGFSNLELGGYLDFQHFCQQKALEANTTETYWYRLNDLVEKIGTGSVEWGCKVNQTFVFHHLSTAVLSGLEYPVCLKVNSDVGKGVRVRESDSLNSKSIGFLFNGTEIFLKGSPAYISTDYSSQRQWIEIEYQGLVGWASLRKKEGEHINFYRCSLKGQNNSKLLIKNSK